MSINLHYRLLSYICWHELAANRKFNIVLPSTLKLIIRLFIYLSFFHEILFRWIVVAWISVEILTLGEFITEKG